MSFSSFYHTDHTLNEAAKPRNGIPHLEILPVDEFISAIKNLSHFIATEKLDGANLVFGFDMEYKFYTSRQAKHGKRFYTHNDYELTANNNGFRSAHDALNASASRLRQVLKRGEAVEIEMLYGYQPNAIVYGNSYIAFLRMVKGDNNEHPDQSKIANLDRIMSQQVVYTHTRRVITEDGTNLLTEWDEREWRFTSTQFIDSQTFNNLNFDKEIKRLQAYLKAKNKIAPELTNMEVMTAHLGKIKKEIREKIKVERERVQQEVLTDYKLPVKEKILNAIVRKLRPSLRTVEVSKYEDFGIEGVVMLDPKTLQQFKIVDRDVYTTINQFNFVVRNEIKATSGFCPRFDISTRDGDIFYDMLNKIADSFGIAGLGTRTNIKRVLKQYIGSTPEQTLTNITKSLKEQDYIILKADIKRIITSAQEQLRTALAKYKQDWKSYKLTLKTGKEVKYSPSIHERTLLLFAEVQTEIAIMKNNLSKSSNLADIVVAIYGSYLKNLYL